jgi:hypothetical protein
MFVIFATSVWNILFSLRHRVMVLCRIAPGNMVLQLSLDVGQQTGGSKSEQLGFQPFPTQFFLH